jgi:hypothetical protein
LLCGTPFFNVVARFLGATMEGRALFLEAKLYDWPYLTLADKTIVEEGAIITGHTVVFQELTIGPVRLAGVIHDKAAVSPGSFITD